MPILHKLLQLYRSRGHDVVFGINPRYTNIPETEAAHIITADRQLTHHLGISPSEIYFLEHLLSESHPQRIFVIGNSFGWSTFALALLAPQASVLAIEAGMEPFTDQWIAETNAIAAASNLRVRVEKGLSPPDVDRVAALADGTFDLVFVDSTHTNKQAVLDYTATARHAHDATIFIFHDVLWCSMQDGIEQIVSAAGLDRHILWRTMTGMALLCRNPLHAALLPVIETFELNALGAEMIRHLQTRAKDSQSQEGETTDRPGDGPALQ